LRFSDIVRYAWYDLRIGGHYRLGLRRGLPVAATFIAEQLTGNIMEAPDGRVG